MYAKKSNAKKDKAINRVAARKGSFARQGFSFADNRPEAMRQRSLQAAAAKGSPMMQLKKYTDEALAINSYARSMIPNAGNRTKEVIASNGASYAGVALIDYLIQQDHSGSWEDRANLAKRSTLAVDIQAANCNQYAALAYSRALKYTGADNVALEYDASHAYAAAYDNEDKAKPGEHTIIDPWVQITGLRKNQQDYYKGRAGNQRAIAKADGANWYKAGYTQRLLEQHGRSVGDKTYQDTAAYGLGIAKTKEKEGADSF